MVVKSIIHFEIPAANVGRLAKFYTRVFGWKIQKAPMPGIDYWLISTGPRGKSVGGGMYKRTGPEDRPRNYINVGKLDPAIRVFKAAGGTEVVGKMEVPGMGWSFIGADPDGNLIALWETKMPARSRSGARSRSRQKK